MFSCDTYKWIVSCFDKSKHLIKKYKICVHNSAKNLAFWDPCARSSRLFKEGRLFSGETGQTAISAPNGYKNHVMHSFPQRFATNSKFPMYSSLLWNILFGWTFASYSFARCHNCPRSFPLWALGRCVNRDPLVWHPSRQKFTFITHLNS